MLPHCSHYRPSSYCRHPHRNTCIKAREQKQAPNHVARIPNINPSPEYVPKSTAQKTIASSLKGQKKEEERNPPIRKRQKAEPTHTDFLESPKASSTTRSHGFHHIGQLPSSSFQNQFCAHSSRRPHRWRNGCWRGRGNPEHLLAPTARPAFSVEADTEATDDRMQHMCDECMYSAARCVGGLCAIRCVPASFGSKIVLRSVHGTAISTGRH